MEFNQANTGDLRAIKNLLWVAGLPSVDFESYLEYFIVSKVNNIVVGFIGMEPYGSVALLRSLVVVEDFRGQGIGRELTRRIIAQARQQGITDFYLLTTSVEKLCRKWGFQKIERHLVPEVIRNTAEFKELCPKTAVCMYRRVTGFRWL